MADWSKTKESKNFEDRTGDTAWNSFDKFMIGTLIGLGVIEDLNEQKRINEQMQREDEEYTRQQREEWLRQHGEGTPKPAPKTAPIFPELEAILKVFKKK